MLLHLGFLEQELLSLKKFSVYLPVDLVGGQPAEKQTEVGNKKVAGPAGKYMILGKTGILQNQLEYVNF